VIDIWGGNQDPHGVVPVEAQEWKENTTTIVWSSSKFVGK
jgi:hypothetical protein